MSNTAEPLPRRQHPNKTPFEGVLTLIETPSDKPPSGSRGHRVLLDRAAAEEALESLIDMAVDFKEGWDGHDAKQKIGIIKRAWIEENRIHVSGFLFGRDFATTLAEMRRSSKPMGMSYELADAHVQDLSAAEWRLVQFTFTGAAILYCDKAAYRATTFNIAASAQGFRNGRLRFSFIDSGDTTGTITPEPHGRARG